MYDNTDTLRLLLDRGAQVNLQDKDGNTALMIASSNWYPRAVQLLLDRGAQPDIRDKKGRTALIIGVRRTNTENVKILLEKGADVRIQDLKGRTALMYIAAEKFCTGDRQQIITELLKYDTDINAIDSKKQTAIMYAITAVDPNNIWEKNEREQIELLISRGAQVDVQVAFMLAASTGREELIQLFLDRGAQLNAQDAEGQTALMHAAKADRGSVEEFERKSKYNSWYDMANLRRLTDLTLLLNQGASVHMRDGAGQTVLMHAARNSHCRATEVVELLLRYGAGSIILASGPQTFLQNAEGQTAGTLALISEMINEQDKRSNTALMHAALAGTEKTVQLLLASGAQTLLQNADGQTAGTLALGRGAMKIVHALVARDPDLDLTKAVPAVLAQGNKEAVALLLDRGIAFDMIAAFMDAASSGNREMVALLLDRGVPVDVQDTQGKTALFYACGNGKRRIRRDIVELLLERGARLDAPKVLINASSTDDDQTVRLLLKYGVPIDSKGEEGMTALMHAAPWCIDVVQVLLDNNVNLNLRDDKGYTALMHAKAWQLYLKTRGDDMDSTLKIIQLLLAAGAQDDQDDIREVERGHKQKEWLWAALPTKANTLLSTTDAQLVVE